MIGEIFGVDGIVVLIVVLVVLFGGAAIPKLARNLGSAKNEFEKGLNEAVSTSSGGPGSPRTADKDASISEKGYQDGKPLSEIGEDGPAGPK